MMEAAVESIWLATAAVDMRTGIEELSLHVQQERITPDQFPGKYACNTWGQVLTKSKFFEYQGTPGSAGSRGQAR